MASHDVQLVRAVLTMHILTWWVIVPFCFAAVTGIAQSLCTPWGVFRHYRVVTKLLLTLLATIVLLVHTQPIEQVATFAAQSVILSRDLRQVRLQLVGMRLQRCSSCS